MGELHGRSYRVLTPEKWFAYCSGMNETPTVAEKALIALSQVLLGDRYYGRPLPDDNVRVLVEIAYEAAKRICEDEGSQITPVWSENQGRKSDG